MGSSRDGWNQPTKVRPDLSAALSAEEFDRWYWTKVELATFARSLGVSASGSKMEIADRIRATLDGSVAISPPRRTRNRLNAPMAENSVIPANVILSRELREWFVEHAGAGFHFNGHMREFLATGEGATLGAAVQHWHATKDVPVTEIAPQFELNRFTRQWRKDHPNGTHQELMAAWHHHRATPTDQRN